MIFFLPFFGTPCCSNAQFFSLANLKHLKNGVPVLTPTQAQWLVIFGNITQKQAPLLQLMYEQMPESKKVLHFGGCSVPLGAYSVVKDVSKIMPITLTINNCEINLEEQLQNIMRKIQ